MKQEVLVQGRKNSRLAYADDTSSVIWRKVLRKCYVPIGGAHGRHHQLSESPERSLKSVLLRKKQVEDEKADSPTALPQNHTTLPKGRSIQPQEKRPIIMSNVGKNVEPDVKFNLESTLNGTFNVDYFFQRRKFMSEF